MKILIATLLCTMFSLNSFAGVYQCVVTGKPAGQPSQTLGTFDIEPAKLEQQGFVMESRHLSFVCEGATSKQNEAEFDLICSINVLNNENAGSVASTNDGAQSLILVTGLDNIIWAIGCFLK